MRYLFIGLLFSLYNIAQGEVPLDLYKQQQQKEISLSSKIEKKQSLITVTIINTSEKISNPIFPIDVGFLGQEDYILDKDLCSYKVLNPQGECTILLIEKKAADFSFKVFAYGKEKQATIISFGKGTTISDFKPIEVAKPLKEYP